MDPLLVLGQIVSLGLLVWGGYLCVAKRDRRLGGERRERVRMEGRRRRHTDVMAANEARSLFVSQRKELAELVSRYGHE